MADEAHLDILWQGVEVWNKWREEKPDLEVDFREADLSGANLAEADLSEANLAGANLIGANLNKADLIGANLGEANLGEAILIEAYFSGANLSNANLINANLIYANLIGADLSGANLSNANLSNANLCYANFAGANLIGANLAEANLIGANLIKANLIGANLSEVDLSEANLAEAILIGANLNKADLIGANLGEANLGEAILIEANLIEANLIEANLIEANLINANLIEANLIGADLSGANLSEADLTGANLERTTVVRTNLRGAILVNCRIYGISAWDPEGIPSEQSGLIITSEGEPEVTVDDLEVAQFVYLLLNNEKIRNMIDTIGRKGVLILGRFTPERKAVLNAIREELRNLDYVPMMFDFEKSDERDFTETIMTLAGMSRFIIADITNPSSSPLELQATVPNYMIPFVPIIQKGERPFAMFKDLYGKFDWVLKPLEYDSAENLVKKLDKAVVKRALKKHAELMLKKAQNPETVDLDDF